MLVAAAPGPGTLLPSAVRTGRRPDDLSLACGVVVDVDEAEVTVEVGVQIHPAVIASSCVVAVAAGDRVLVALSDVAVVVAVLTPRGAQVVLGDDDRPLHIRGGDVTVKARDTVRICGRRAAVEAQEASVAAVRLSLAAGGLVLAAKSLRTVADRIEKVADTMATHATRSVRQVSGTDEVRVGQWRLAVQGTLDATARAIAMVGSKIVRIDGDQVQLG